MKDDNYKAWDVRLSSFPSKGSMEDRIRFFSRFGILAANIHNTQPWLFSIKNSILTISPNSKYQLTDGDPSGNNMYITLGCCVTNIEVVAAHFKYKTTVRVTEKDKRAICALSFSPVSKLDKDLSNLAQYITKRYSNKLPYLPKPVEKRKVATLENISIEGLKTVFTENDATRKKIADLQEKAVKAVATKDFSRELSYWVTANNTKRYDGMPGFVEGFPPLKAIIGKLSLRYFPSFIVNIIAKKNKFMMEGSPLLGIIHNEVIQRKTAVHVGRLYQRIALTATALEINCTPMHAVIENKQTAKSLAKLLGFKKTQPRFLFRLGYSDNSPYHTPRRPLEKFYA